MHDPRELDRSRERWSLVRRRLGQSADAEHRSLGLARRVEDLSARLLILPGDPFATDLSFDDGFWRWWTAEGPSPFGTRVHWTNTRPTVDAAVKYKGAREKWTTYLAVHRHGGVEIGCNPSRSDTQKRRYVRLVRLVGLVWIGASAQAEAASRYGLTGPWEMTLILYETENAHLAGFGTGWREPFQLGVSGFPAQQEPHVVIRRELRAFPESDTDVQDLAFEVGARIEDAWGVKHRRFLDGNGETEGEFNPGRWRL